MFQFIKRLFLVPQIKALLRVGNPANDHARSPHWPAVERQHLLAEPVCQWCGGGVARQVHHIVPFHIDRSLELDPSNLITLCMDKGKECHLRYGHKGNWHDFDPDIRAKCLARRGKP